MTGDREQIVVSGTTLGAATDDVSRSCEIEELVAPVTGSDIDALADLTLDAVASGAQVSFMQDSTFAEVRSFWERSCRSLAGAGVLLAVRDELGIAGTVQLQPAWAPNQPHRAEVAKLIVHRRARRCGLGEALMREIEARALAGGFALLTLDTKAGDGGERLYLRLGWMVAGVIPGFALDPQGGTPRDCVFFYKVIARSVEER